MSRSVEVPPRNPAPRKPWGSRLERGLLGFFAGLAVLESGLMVLGVHMEWFAGIANYNLRFVAAMTLLPLAAGLVVGLIYGYGGKYLAHFPPLVDGVWHYWQSLAHPEMIPQGAHLLPWQLFGFFVIWLMEASAVGAFIGEIIARRWMSWDHAMPPRRADSEYLPEDE